jgi:hypothetical protein
MADLEARGVPGVFVASDEFADGAAHQARAIGADPPAVFVAHPIQDRSDAELIALADGAFEQVAASLLGSPEADERDG